MTDESKLTLDVERTGDDALDDILGGGIPARSVIVIAGAPGSGKTILTMQMLFHAARRGGRCLYFTTLSEPAIKVIRYMQMFEFFDAALLDQNVVFADLGSCIREGADRVFSELERRVEAHEPTFVAIDSFRAVGELLRGTASMRPFVYDLAVQMAGWGATTALVGEYTPDEFSSFAEFAIADGIIRVGSERNELTSVREMEVLKMRGMDYASGRHFFDITRAGVSFYPRVRAPAQVTRGASSDAPRAQTGIAGLDELLGGGLPRASTTMVQGGTGAGKTLLGLQFLIEGARRGEKGIVYTLEEGPDELRSNARSLGWDLAELEARGLIAIVYASPVELSTDRFLNRARQQVERMGARRAVFDSLTTMALGIPSERRYKEMVYAIAKHLRMQGVTVMMTVETDQLLGTAQIGGQGVSFIADNLIQLRYVEVGGRLERAISVLKARGIPHDSELRGMTIGPGGIEVDAARFRDMRGVLTGLPDRDPRKPG